MKQACYNVPDLKLYDLVATFTQRFAPQRYDYAQHFYRQSDQYATMLAYLLLCMILGRPVGELQRRANRKPYFMGDFENYSLSITHTDQLVAVAVADDNIGIDSESWHNVDDAVMDVVVSAGEKRQLCHDATLKTIFWTAKEALSKLRNADWYSSPATELQSPDTMLMDLKNPRVNFETWRLPLGVITIASEQKTTCSLKSVTSVDIRDFIRLCLNTNIIV